MDAQTGMIVLRVFHIVGGAIWLGIAVMVARFLLPAAGAMGPGGAALMREMGRLRLPVFMTVALAVTVVSGLAMMWSLESASRGLWSRSPMGMTISAGAVLGILAAIIAITMARPATARLATLGEQLAASPGPPSEPLLAEMHRLRARLTRAARVVAVLLLLATGLMAIARYV